LLRSRLATLPKELVLAGGALGLVLVFVLAALIVGHVTPNDSRAPSAQQLVTPQADEAQVNRADCSEIIDSGAYASDSERDWFGENCPITPASDAQASVTSPPEPEAAPAVVRAAAPGPVNDRLVVQRLGIDAPVHLSYVPASGQMGNPDGAYDVVWYDFSSFAGLGGYPGAGGNAVLAGHVDYHPNIQAVFWTLRNARAGDAIDYYTAAGQHLQYTVEWKREAGPDDDFVDYVSQAGKDMLTLITCDGVFNPVTRHYDHRSVVRAVRS